MFVYAHLDEHVLSNNIFKIGTRSANSVLICAWVQLRLDVCVKFNIRVRLFMPIMQLFTNREFKSNKIVLELIKGLL